MGCVDKRGLVMRGLREPAMDMKGESSSRLGLVSVHISSCSERKRAAPSWTFSCQSRG